MLQTAVVQSRCSTEDAPSEKAKTKLCYYLEGIALVSSQACGGRLWAAITEFVPQKHEEHFGNDCQDGNPVALGTKQTHSNEYFPNNRRLKLEMGTAERGTASSPSRARVAGSGSSRSQGHPLPAEDVWTTLISVLPLTVTAGQAIKENEAWVSRGFGEMGSEISGKPHLSTPGSHSTSALLVLPRFPVWGWKPSVLLVHKHCFVFKHLQSTATALAETSDSDKFSFPQPSQPKKQPLHSFNEASFNI